jgi:predicted porin
VEETTSAGVISRTSASAFSGGEAASSRIGFRGVEQIDGDISATFNLEYGFTAGTGSLVTATGTTASTQGSESTVRTAIAGLASKKFGSIAFGRQTTGIHDVVAGNVFGGNNMAGDMTYSNLTTTSAGAGATALAATGRVSSFVTRANGMLTYISPTISGLNLRIDYSNNTATGTVASASGANQPGIQSALQGATLAYTWGPITAKAAQAIYKYNELTAATAVFDSTNSGKNTVNAANIMYKDKGITVQYTYAISKLESLATTPLQISQVNANKLSASYQIGAFMPFVQYGQGNTEGAVSASAANTVTKDKAMQIGTEYALSKRTNLYAVYGTQERKLATSSAKSTVTDVAAGMKHTF